MLLPYKYTYLAGSLLFLVYWIWFYKKYPEFRKEQVILSVIFAISGPFISYFLFINDWWQPETVFGARIGIEDVIFGFACGGLAAVIFAPWFKKSGVNKIPIKRILRIFPLGVAILFSLILYFGLGLHSFYANIIAGSISTCLIWLYRKDLISISLVSGLILTIISMPVYWILELLSAGWIRQTWHLERLSQINFLSIPIEDLIWFFFVGMLVSILYPFYVQTKYEKKYEKN